MRKLIAIVGAVTVLGMVFAASFLGALHQPEPHDVPIAVVGPSQAAAGIDAVLDAKAPGAFTLTPYADEGSARNALADREVDAVLIPDAGRLVVASAGGRTGSTVITQVFQAAAQAQGRPLAVEDAIPLPPGDAGGISGMFYVLALVIPGIAVAVLTFRVAPGLGLAGRLGLLAVAALVVGTANAWLSDVVFGALPGRFAGLVAVSAGVTLAIGLVSSGLMRIAGAPGVGLAALLFIPIGLPASGGPLGARFIPEWYAAVGQVLPVGQAAEAVKNVVHFDGAALATPLFVLGGWALLGLVLLVVPRRRTETAARPVLVG
ncbi:DUF3533 domain-containing protein [Planotetraspora phitsanulokensis]|uniref:Membrane protein n=1 Tax=Planotetraspora phitsanulokensis TaxID=575192 RepID=A0A8J3U881_9ACTN|nr:hypothetical protein [Planotetraspora phitsanulokensis]GII37799.1 membrane protein [Planotetraspora phitsanulokensis]